MLNPNYLELVKAQLTQFATQSDFETVLTTAFGTKIDRTKIFQLRQQWLKGDFSLIPPIEVLTNGELGNANGGYAGSEDKIFVSSDFLARNASSLSGAEVSGAVTGLLLEEIGHKIDRFFNGDVDSAGDEGDIFSRLVSGQILSAQTLALLKAEDDTAVIIVDGKRVSIEQQYIPGTDGDDILNGDRNGVVADDYIEGIGGNDQLYGKGGNDILDGGWGDDSLDGGDGNDHLYGGRGDDSIYSGTGADIIDGKITTDFIVVNSGKDYLYIANYGDTANTTIKYTAVSDGKITGGSNNGTTFKNIDSVSFATGSGNDHINISAAITGGGFYNYNHVNSGAGDDLIIGGLNAAHYLYGGDGKDYIEVNGNGANFLNGGSGNDSIKAGSGNDIVYGGEGDDDISSGKGVDFIDGQDGNDILGIYNSSDTANTTIVYTTATNGKITGGFNNGTTFQNIESVSFGTGSGTDNINIDAATGNNYLFTGAGKDRIDAHGGNNAIFAGTGNDDIYTGAGSDTIYAGADADIIWSGKGKDTIDGGDGNDDFLGIDNRLDTANTRIEYNSVSNGKITGGSNNGTTFKNIDSFNFSTGAGNDYIDISPTTAVVVPGPFSVYNFITAGAGNDIIYTGTGNDLISAGTGNDDIRSSKGADFIDGDDGNDFLFINNYGDLADTKIEYFTATNGKITGGFNNGTTFKNIESGYFSTGSGNDYINIFAATGDSSVDAGRGNNRIVAGDGNNAIGAYGGNDIIAAGGGNDTIVAGAGLDTINGGDGQDSIYIDNDHETVDINISTVYFYNGTKSTITNGVNHGTTFQEIESGVFNTGAGKDKIYLTTLTGTVNVSTGEGDDDIAAGSGNDLIDTGAGNNKVIAGAGNDSIVIYAGANNIDGGIGNDRLTINNTSDTVNTTTLYRTTNDGTITGGDGNGTIFKNIESFNWNAGSAYDYIDVSAATGDNDVNAGGGTDYIRTGIGNDKIDGGIGNDVLEGGTAADSLDGGAGNDYFYIRNESDTANNTIVYLTATTGEVFGGLNHGTTFKNIESSGIWTGSGSDRIDLSLSAGDNYISSGAGDDTINGSAGNDEINGGKGVNIINGNGGIDSLDIGDSGYPILDTANTTILYTTALAGTVAGGSSNGTTFKNIERIKAQTGSGNDEIDISAATGDSSIITNAGNDILIGGAGNDILIGGTGNDTIRGGAGNDIYNTRFPRTGGIGYDTYGEIGDDTYIIDADVDLGTDTIYETVTGGIDTLDFSTTSTKAININLNTITTQTVATGVQLVIPVVSIENVYGGTLNDTLIGNDLNNTIYGGGGIDTLNGGTGNDKLTGGLGDDKFLFNGGKAITGAVTVSSLLGKDTIADFNKVAGNQDKIVLSKGTFAQITTALGGLTTTNFLALATDAAVLASTSTAAILYSSGTGNIFYNQNGAVAGVGANGGIFATVTSNPVLAATDFSVVA